MKTIITFTFLLFSFLGFSQTTREEVVERNKYGQKLAVNTYTGTGNSEKLVKRTTYHDFASSTGMSISVKPWRIQYFGAYKESVSTTVYNTWGVIKEEIFSYDGVLESTWKTTNTLIP